MPEPFSNPAALLIALLCILVAGSPIGGVTAWIAVLLYNRIAGGLAVPRVVPKLSLGDAVGVMFSILVANFIVLLPLAFGIGQGPAFAGLSSDRTKWLILLACVPVFLPVSVAVYARQIPTTFL